MLGVRVARRFADSRLLVRPAIGLVALIVVQICLGAGDLAYELRLAHLAFGQGRLARPLHRRGRRVCCRLMVTTAHVAVGSLILATSVALALRSLRLLQAVPRAASRGT